MSPPPTFGDFIIKYPKYQKFSGSKSAQEVFDYLSQPETIFKMTTANDIGKAALAGCIVGLEDNFVKNSGFDFTQRDGSSDTVKQAVGSMIKVILEPFGYTPKVQKKLTVGLSDFFASATHYECNPKTASMKLVQKIIIVPIDQHNNYTLNSDTRVISA